jgi:4-amino-4-deoxy-L-arabinose transferase-like glycosyltransferase
VLGGAARRSSFDGDENLYMYRGRYFAHLFLNRDLANPEWGDNYWTHTQPMLTNYLVGGWLWVRGYDLFQMPPPSRWGAGGRQNRAEGRVPGPELLLEARQPSVGITAAAALLLFALGCVLGSPPAGLAAGALLVASPLAQRFMVRALSEAPLAFFILLTLLLGLLGARRGRDGGLPARWALAVGVALGLALATKLTAALSFAALLGWALLVALAAGLRQSGSARARLARAWAAGCGWALALALALGVFVASNPHLYINPLEHTLHLVRQRADEMREQQRILPEDALYRPLERARFVFGGSLVEQTASGARRLPLEAGLAALGAAALLIRTWRGWRRTGFVPAEGLLLLTAAAYFGGVTAGLLLAWPHYLVPTLVLGIVLSCVGLATFLDGLATLAGRLRGGPRGTPSGAGLSHRDTPEELPTHRYAEADEAVGVGRGTRLT